MDIEDHIKRILDIYDPERKTELEFDLFRLTNSIKKDAGIDIEETEKPVNEAPAKFNNSIDFIKGKIAGSFADSVKLVMEENCSLYNKVLLIISIARALSGWHNINEIPPELWNIFSNIASHTSIMIDHEQFCVE